MSLDVHVYRLDDEGRKDFLRSVPWKEVMQGWREQGLSPEETRREGQRLLMESEPGRKLAGWEVWRTKVYGSQAARSLGLELLPSLAVGDLDVTGERLDQLAQEVGVLVQNVGLVAQEAGHDAETLLVRLHNIANAAAEAKEIGGGVVIW